MAPLVILVLGATGRYLSLVHTLLAAGHRVRAGTRRPEAATGVRQRGVEIVRVDLDDVGSIVEAATGADAVFAAGTFHRTGAEGDVLHGRNVIDAVRIAEAPHLVYVSVAGADRPTDVPLFKSKRRVEDYLTSSDVPFTIVAPVYLMENVWNPWNEQVLARGHFPSPVRPERTIHQVPIGDVIGFASFVLGHRDGLLGERVEIASDELSGSEAASIVGRLVGRAVEVEVTVQGGPRPLFSWLEQIGYGIDIDGLRRRFPTIGWHTFAEWARAQDWSIVTSSTGS